MKKLLLLFLLSAAAAFSAVVPPTEATVTQVNAGTSRNTYVSPFGLANWSGGGGGGGGNPGGTGTQIQYRVNATTFGGIAGSSWNGSALVLPTFTDSALTAGRVTFAGTAGLLSDSASLTFNSGTGALTATTFIGALTGNASTATNVAVGGITGLGTGVATALAINTGSAGAPVLFNGNAGTPSALVGTNITGTAASLTAGAVTNGVTASNSFGTDNVLLRSDGTGRGSQSTGITVDDSNNITGVTAITATTLTATTLTATADAIESSIFAADAGSTDTYVITLTPAITSYVTGAHYWFKANTANTGAATININGLGAKTIVKVAGGITTTLADNDIRAGQWVDLAYDGTNMQMQSLLGNAPAGGGNVSNTGTPTSGQAAEWTSATVIQGVAVTGSGNYVKATSPTLTTPTLGVATATSINKVAITAPSTGSTLTIADGQTLTVTNTTTLARQSSTGLPVEFILAASDMTTTITTGTNKVYFRAPYAFTVTEVRAALNTAQTGGSIFTVDINESGTTILSTKLTIDNNETTSTTAATPPVISDTAIADDAIVSFDVDTVGTGTPNGLVVMVKGYR